MEQGQQAQAKLEDIDPLVPIDVIRPPQHRGGNDPEAFIKPLEPEEVPESEIEEHQKNREEPKKEIPYKGDVNAPVDAEHPLAEPPSQTQEPE